MDNYKIITPKIICLLIFLPFAAVSQERDTMNWCMSGTNLLVGSDYIEGKRIISGFYLTQLTDTEFRLDLSILEDWVEKDSVNTIVKLVPKSLSHNRYKVDIEGKELSVVKLKSKNKLEVLLTKECVTSSVDRSCCYFYQAKINLPKRKKHFVKSLPVMWNK